MINPGNIAVVKAAERLLIQYGFDLDGTASTTLFDTWLRLYSPRWIRLAIIEALYQGRYKAVSVEQLLAFWLRRGEAQTHFNSEFEAMICRNLPRDLRTLESETTSEAMTNGAWAKLNQNRNANTPPSNPAPALIPEESPKNINQFQPQAPNELTSHFTEKLNAIAQAWKVSQIPSSTAVHPTEIVPLASVLATTLESRAVAPISEMDERSQNQAPIHPNPTAP